MKIIKVSQEHDREAWLELRKDKITGTRVGKVKPLTRGTDRTPEGFWQMLADRLAIAKDGEPERDRGLRLENEALKKTAKRFKLKLNYDPGMWESDIDKDIAVSPDGAEEGDTPTYAAEAKCFDSKNHIKYVMLDRRASKEKDYRPYDSVPKDNKHQVIQHFVVNENLDKLYFTLYDDRIVLDKLSHHVIVITRESVKDETDMQLLMEKEVLKDLRDTIKEIKSYE